MRKSWFSMAVILVGLAAGGQETLPSLGVVTIDHPEIYSQVVALSDVHGMYPALLTLLKENALIDGQNHWTGGKTLLVVAGDSIDKGSQSIDVLDLWISLTAEAQTAGGRVLHLLGNHEAEFLANPTPENDKAQALFEELDGRGIPVEQLSDPSFPRGHYLRSLPVAARIGSWLFCHSGYLPNLSWDQFTHQASRLLSLGAYSDEFLIGSQSILEAKNWWTQGSASRAAVEQRLTAAGLAGVVFGHQPKGLGVEGQIAQSQDGRLIKIDNGMAPEAGAHRGSLLLFPEPSQLASSAAGGLNTDSLQAFALIRGRRQELSPENFTSQ